MPELILGPLLRYVGETDATVWVETSERCEVEVLERRCPTWQVEGHHYALITLDGLPAGQETPYEVRLDGELRWPEPDSPYPASTIRTLGGERPLGIAFGSCRLTTPHHDPYCLSKDEHDDGREVDALHAFTRRMLLQDPIQWPHLLLFLGDQVYADEVSPGARAFIQGRRDTASPPGEAVADFEEYTRLYWDAWTDPPVRWLLSTVSSAMVWDDHDVHDDWNTSQAWVDAMRAEPWWEERIAGAYMSYWAYQHLGNLSPAELARDPLFERVLAAPDAGPLLREFAEAAEERSAGTIWSYSRDLGATRLVVVDSRAGRVLNGGGRAMVDEREWSWIEQHARGEVEHLLLATSLPYLLSPGMHHLETWNEAVCDGAWGTWAARLGERVRQGLDLEHWAAFDKSFRDLSHLVQEVAAGRRGKAPASIVALSGDVHHAYLAEVAFRRDAGVESPVYQATCSPIRNPLDSRERRMMRIAASRPAAVIARALARAAGVEDPPIRWRLTSDPTFDNQIASLQLSGREARLRIERTVRNGAAPPSLHPVLERRLA